MSAFEQLQILKQNIANIYDPNLLAEMNKKYLELEAEIKNIKKLEVVITLN